MGYVLISHHIRDMESNIWTITAGLVGISQIGEVYIGTSPRPENTGLLHLENVSDFTRVTMLACRALLISENRKKKTSDDDAGAVTKS